MQSDHRLLLRLGLPSERERERDKLTPIVSFLAVCTDDLMHLVSLLALLVEYFVFFFHS